MFALLLSLQISFGKTTFDTQEEDVTQVGSHAVMLDRVLAHYGPEAQDARKSLRQSPVWPQEDRKHQPGSPEPVYDKILSLFPKSEEQRSKKRWFSGWRSI